MNGRKEAWRAGRMNRGSTNGKTGGMNEGRNQRM